MTIFDYLKTARLVTDGAMGTYYASHEESENGIPEYANISAPDKIKNIHKEYISSGANLLRTNTFAASRSMLGISKAEQEEILRAGCKIARSAVSEGKSQVFIAGDIGPIPESATTEEKDIISEYKDMIDIFIQEDVDAILFETFSDARYIKQLTNYIKNKKKQVFVIAEFCINKNGYTRSGVSAAKLLEQISTITWVDAVGFNCGIGSGHMYQVLKNLTFPKWQYFMAAPNAGYPDQFQNRTVFTDNAVYFAKNCEKIAELGAAIVGGCCGTTPKYIEETKKVLKKFAPVIPNEKKAVNSIEVKEGAIASERAVNELVAEKKKENSFLRLLNSGKKVVAVELDPPYDATDTKILTCAEQLKDKNVDIITLADSPMGRSRIDSILMSIKLRQVTGLPVMPHVCCRDKNMIAMRSALLGAYINDIRNILIVTGDPVPDGNRLKTTGVFDYNSIRLMEYVKEMNEEHFSKEPLVYGGAFDPGAKFIDRAIERMKKKIEAGAEYFLTQPVYSEESIEKIKYTKSQVDTKVLCGIMPLVSYTNANFIKNEFTGIQVPEEIVARYRKDMTREEAEFIGAEIANELIEKLAPFVDGFYFMLPFNRVSLMEKIQVPT